MLLPSQEFVFDHRVCFRGPDQTPEIFQVPLQLRVLRPEIGFGFPAQTCPFQVLQTILLRPSLVFQEEFFRDFDVPEFTLAFTILHNRESAGGGRGGRGKTTRRRKHSQNTSVASMENEVE